MYKHRSHSLILNFAIYRRKIKKKFSKRNISVLYLRSVPIFAAEKRNFDAVVHISSLPSHIPFIYQSYTLHIASLYLGCSLGVLWTFLRRTLNLSSFFLPSSYLLPTHHFVFTKRIFHIIIVLYEALALKNLTANVLF